jgi:hypothetical protein
MDTQIQISATQINATVATVATVKPKSKKRESKPKTKTDNSEPAESVESVESVEKAETAEKKRVVKKCKILVAHLDKLEKLKEVQEEEEEEVQEAVAQEEVAQEVQVQEVQVQEVQVQEEEAKEEAKKEVKEITKKKRAPRGPSAKKLAAAAAAVVAESEVVSMVLDMKAAFVEPETQPQPHNTTNPNPVKQDIVELGEEPYEPFPGFDDFSDEYIDSLRLEAPTEAVAAVAAVEAVAAVSAQKKRGRVYRHEFCLAVFDKLKEFTAEHSHLDRKAHKLAWNQWVSDNGDIIAEETERLRTVGYAGDVVDKMFKACRYYVAKRLSPAPTAASSPTPILATEDVQSDSGDSDETETDTETTTTTTTTTTMATASKKPKAARARTYIPIQKPVLQAMDEHIIMVVLNADSESDAANTANDVKPSKCYVEFCNTFSELISDETFRLIRAHSEHPSTTATTATTATVVSVVADKLKATYKNRMFLIKRNH